MNLSKGLLALSLAACTSEYELHPEAEEAGAVVETENLTFSPGEIPGALRGDDASEDYPEAQVDAVVADVLIGACSTIGPEDCPNADPYTHPVGAESCESSSVDKLNSIADGTEALLPEDSSLEDFNNLEVPFDTLIECSLNRSSYGFTIRSCNLRFSIPEDDGTTNFENSILCRAYQGKFDGDDDYTTVEVLNGTTDAEGWSSEYQFIADTTFDDVVMGTIAAFSHNNFWYFQDDAEADFTPIFEALDDADDIVNTAIRLAGDPSDNSELKSSAIFNYRPE